MPGKRKILITGVNGILGISLSSSLKDNELLTPNRDEFDLTDFKKVSSYIIKNKPNVILHAAAHTNVEEAEIEPTKAWSVNALGTLNLCRCIVNDETKLVFVSSTGVYGHNKVTPWLDFDSPEPPTIHHLTKFKAEEIIKNHVKNHLILRTGWLFGGGTSNPKNFVYNRYLESLGKKILYSNPIQFGNPTSTLDLAKQISLLIDHDLIGTYNCVNKGCVSRLEYVEEILNLFDVDVKVEAIKGDFKRLAKVSNNEMAHNYFLELLGLDIMPDFRESLKVYIEQFKEDLSNEKK